jgi:hypothetical protein
MRALQKLPACIQNIFRLFKISDHLCCGIACIHIYMPAVAQRI